jgi:uncharacterized protein YjbJ (UPF0337 family)
MGAMTDKIKGKAKEIEGKLTGDRVRTGQGKVEGAKGEAGMKAQRAKSRVKGAAARAKARVKRATSRTRAKSRARAY